MIPYPCSQSQVTRVDSLLPALQLRLSYSLGSDEFVYMCGGRNIKRSTAEVRDAIYPPQPFSLSQLVLYNDQVLLALPPYS